jgi:hypothetical protein
MWRAECLTWGIRGWRLLPSRSNVSHLGRRRPMWGLPEIGLEVRKSAADFRRLARPPPKPENALMLLRQT